MRQQRGIQRREFLRSSNAVVLATTLSRMTPGRSLRERIRSSVSDPKFAITLRDPRARALASSAIDAAKSAGAHYADVRLTNTVTQYVSTNVTDPTGRTVQLGMSVRALVNGYWGWVATPILSTAEAVRLARLATQFARLSASRGDARPVDLGTIPVIANGEWQTPVKYDPFELDILDIYHWLYGLGGELADLGASRHAPASIAWNGEDRQSGCSVSFTKQERRFASTEGADLLQTVITTAPQVSVQFGNPLGGAAIPYFNTPVQGGWEHVTETPIVDLIVKEMDRLDETPPLVPKPMDIGRYDCVFSATWMAQILSRTLAPAIELDRVLGYEANATGSSYLGADPLTLLGTPVASPLVTITAERSNPKGLATAKWDDEGVATQDFTLVQQGTLVGAPTTREQASWITPWMNKHNQPVQSRGCLSAPSALEEPMQHLPNLVLHPGKESADEESLIRDVEHGLHFSANVGARFIRVDWQGSDVYILPVVATEIRHGKATTFPPLTMGLLFRANEFWKNIQALGGSSSAVYTTFNGTEPFTSTKGDPVQSVPYSIGAVPARVNRLAFIDPTRKA